MSLCRLRNLSWLWLGSAGAFVAACSGNNSKEIQHDLGSARADAGGADQGDASDGPKEGDTSDDPAAQDDGGTAAQSATPSQDAGDAGSSSQPLDAALADGATRDAAQGPLADDAATTSSDATFVNCPADLCSVGFRSGIDWPSYALDPADTDAGSVGPARLVCVNTVAAPPHCPSDALVYNASTSTGGWNAVLSLDTAAQWVWRGDVTVQGPADLALAYFEKRFVLGAEPAGSVQIAADDQVQVRVNGTLAGTCGSTTDLAVAGACQRNGLTVDVTPFLHEGQNVITIIGQNGPATFAGCVDGCTYARNFAAVAFAGKLTSCGPCP